MKRVALDVAWAAALALVTSAILVHAGGVWDAVTSGDLHAMLLPKFEYAAHRLFHDGALALWNPWELCGMPILGAAQGAVLYPPVLVAFALAPPWTALQIVFGVHVFVLALGLTAYLRRHDVGRPQAVLATIVTLAGVLTTPDFVGVDHPSFLASVAWVPAMLLAAERGSVVGVALTSAAQWLAGYPEFPPTTALLVGVVVLIGGTAPWRARVVALVAGFGLGAALAAVQLLPLLETVGEGTRAAQEWQFALWRRRSGLHSAWDFPTQLAVRQGWAPLALAGVALAGSRPRATRIAWTAALLWCVVALNPPFDVLYHLPGFRGVRFGYAWSALAGIFLGVLVADGLARLERSRRTWAPWLGRALGVAIVVAGVRTLDAAPTLDFPNVGLRFRAPDAAVLAARAPVLRHWLDTSPGARVLAERELVAGSGLRDGLRLPVGHEPAVPPRRVMHLLEEAGLVNPLGRWIGERWIGGSARPEILALLGARFVVVPRGAVAPFLAAGFAPRADLPPDDVLLEGTALPRARLVHRVAVAETPTDEGTLAALFEHAGDLGELAVVDRLPAGGPHPAPGGENADRATVVDESPEQVVVDATAGSAALLVLADTFYPGWTATIDGVPAEIVRADHAFRGVAIDAGSHRIVFRYAPSSLRAGGLISAAALLVVAFLAVRSRRNGPSAAFHAT